MLLVFIFSFVDNTNESHIYLAISIGELCVIIIHGWGLGKLKFFKDRVFYFIPFAIALFTLNFLLMMIDYKIISLIAFVVIVSVYILLILKTKISKQVKIDN